MQLYYLLGQKTYRRNLQYRMAHILDNMGSAIFGYIMMFIWLAAVGPQGVLGRYSAQQLVYWIAFGQVMWNVTAVAQGLNIQLAVRSGDISLELLRPIDYFFYVISREAGQQLYALIYRSLPIFLLYIFTVGYHSPSFTSVILLIPALSLAVYNALCLSYLVGILSFWTTDVRWAHYLNNTMMIAASGIQIPVDLLPGFVGITTPLMPWAAIGHYPSLIYLEFAGAEALLLPAIWAGVLTLLCRGLTRLARTKLEVQGG